MHKNIRPGDVVYDIGAEEGDMSALIAGWVKGPKGCSDAASHYDPAGNGCGCISVGLPGGIVLFEPNPRVWPNIRAIWEANNLPHPLGMFAGFAGDTSDFIASHIDTSQWPESAFGPIIGDHGFCQLNERPDIPRVRLDHFELGTGKSPDVITMDVEGAEILVLEGAINLLRQYHPLVYVSLHPEFMRETYSRDAVEVFRLMKSFDYQVEFLAWDHEAHFVFWHPPTRQLVR